VKVTLMLAILCFYVPLSFGSSQSPVKTAQITVVKNAVVRYSCFQVYWHGWNRKQGTPLPLQLRIEGDEHLSLPYEIKADGKRFIAWIKGVEFHRGNRIDQFLTGRVSNDSAAIILSEGYNADLRPPVPGHAENRSRFKGSQVITDTLTIPTDCTPRYDSPTPQKERMLRAVVTTMEKRLSSFVRTGAAQYPKEVTLIIADFNVDYPSTYILVDLPGELYTYSVTLHDPQDYDSDQYEREGEYPFGNIRIKPEHKELLAKIRKHGIVRKIILAP